MEHSIEIDAQRKLVRVTTSGNASLDGFRSFVTQLLEPPYAELLYDVILDYRYLNFGKLTSEEVTSIAEFVAENAERIPPVKHALVVSDVLAYGLTQVFEIHAVESRSMELRVFLSYDEAVTWVRGAAEG